MKALWNSRSYVFLSPGVILLACSMAMGQSTFGSLTGAATDPSGAVIPKVQVTLTNLGTDAKQITTTNAAGIYVFVNVLPGNYSIVQ
jgi:Carboxypeptidase regulatory-like domain